MCSSDLDSPILTYLEPAASSTVELVVELFEYQRVEIEVLPTEATVMYAGMLVDTNYFRNHVGSRTFQIASKLKEKQANVEKLLRLEEEQFARTLERGLSLLDDALAQVKDGELSGEVAFKLYDTYGFPLDLTADVCREREIGRAHV